MKGIAMSIDNDDLYAMVAEELSPPAYRVFRVLKENFDSGGKGSDVAGIAVLTGLTEAEVEQAADELDEKGIVRYEDKCNFCELGFSNPNDWYLHELQFHPKSIEVTCRLCGARITGADEIEAHGQTQHPQLWAALENIARSRQ